MKTRAVTGDIIGVALRQMGATKIKEFQSYMHIVDFVLDNGLEISYVFNITKNDKVFLQRMKPYAIPQGKFGSDKEVVAFIKEDMAKFKNATNTRKFPTFLSISEKGNELVARMEKLFLNHKVKEGLLQDIESDIDKMLLDIDMYEKEAKALELEVDID